ncbi:MAG: Omp28-related outer membrane protein [Bacteroidetes bacterium]|nr:Omp28-related outer membrane protein [Bacteroidota bacterium]
MRKFIITLLALLTSYFVYSQSIPRNVVVLEIGTGTWCQFCPGAANGADQLVTEGKSIAVIENHNGDTYANTYSNSRNSYYAISGYPTGFFNGTSSYVGGAQCPSGNVYSTYLSLYNSAIATPSPVNICFTGTNAGNNYTMNVIVTKLAQVTGADLRLHLFLTESHISQSWQGCMTEVNFVTRLMVPGVNGTPFSFAGGDVQNFTLNFTKDPTWNATHCEVVVFVQDNSSKTIYNGLKCSLNSLPSTLMTFTDFSGAPSSGCAPFSSSFSQTSTGANSFAWNFPSGTPSTSSLANPVISYTSPGTNDVSLVISNGACKETHTKAGYIVVAMAPVVQSPPQGNSAMCINPGIRTYTISPAQYADSYTWELTPSTAGTLTPSGTSCSVNYSPSFTGTATLRVQASNTCGPGNWSPDLTITISNPPALPSSPSGPAAVCENTNSSDYTIPAVPNATAYTWELSPGNAGILTNLGTSAFINWATGWSGTVTLRVAAITGSCQGPWSNSYTITVNPSPALFSVTGGGTYCGQGGSGMPVGLQSSLSGTDYTLYLSGSPVSNSVAGTGSAITFGNQTASGMYTVMGTLVSTNCSKFMNGNVYINTDPSPPTAPGDPVGQSHVYTSVTPTTDYMTTGGNYATTYAWLLTPADAGTISGSNTTSLVTWNHNWVGTAQLSVQGVNTCGGGTFSNVTNIIVETAVGIMEKGQARLVSIYPNPAKGDVKIIPFHAMKAGLKVSNSIGLTVLDLEGVSLDGEYKLDLTGLNPGLYFISINDNGNTQVLKLILE